MLTSTRRIIDRFEDELGEITFQNVAEVETEESVGATELKDLSSGVNTITVPTGAVGVTIIFPSDNEETILLKRVTGDTGIALDLTAPVSLSLSSVPSFVLTTGGIIEAVRFIWS